MPYLHCPTCRLTTFAPVRHSSHEQCPRCASELSPEPRRFFRGGPPATRDRNASGDVPALDATRVEVDAVREALPVDGAPGTGTADGAGTNGSLASSVSRVQDALQAGGRRAAPRRGAASRLADTDVGDRRPAA